MSRWREAISRLPVSGVKQYLKTASPGEVADILATLAQAERVCVEKKKPFSFGMLNGADYDEILRTVRTLKKKWERKGLKQVTARKQQIANTGYSYEQPQEQQEVQAREGETQQGRLQQGEGERLRQGNRAGRSERRRNRRKGIRIQ